MTNFSGGKSAKWEKRGLILKPDPNVDWLAGGAGPCFARLDPQNPTIAQLYVSGRDSRNRSRIGRVLFDLQKEKVVEVSNKSVLPLGTKGAFDENGTSYPYLVENHGALYMFYTGWIQGVHVRWYNDLGLATSKDGLSFKRFSRAPVIPRNNLDYIGIGSTCVIKDNEKWLMWYTRFERWGSPPDRHEHYYNIKHATSSDGIIWATRDDICIDFNDDSEYAISKPCVVKIDSKYVMWYSHRGESYRAGLACSEDGQSWRRMDERVGIDVSPCGWDSEMLCYPFVLDAGDKFYMFYNGNSYGTSGLGFAVADRKTMLEMI